MRNNYGAFVWFVPDCYYPSTSTGKMKSHESICILNPGKKDANMEITLYFEDRDKMEGFKTVCKAERTHHVRMDKIKDADGNGVPMDIPYAMMVESDVEIIAQYSRLDSTQAEMTLMTTIAYPMR